MVEKFTIKMHLNSDYCGNEEKMNDETQVGGRSVVCYFSLPLLEKHLSCDEMQIFSRQAWTYDEKQQLLNKLAQLMLDYRKGICLAKQFCGILLEILTRAQNLVKKDIKQNHLLFSLTLSHLLPLYPHILSFTLNYFQEIGPFFGQSEEISFESSGLVIETVYRLLAFSPTRFRWLWNYGKLCEPNDLASEQSKQLFVKAMSIVLNCNNQENIELFGTEIEDSKEHSSFYEDMNNGTCFETRAVEERGTRDCVAENMIDNRIHEINPTTRMDRQRSLDKNTNALSVEITEQEAFSTKQNKMDIPETLNEIIFCEDDLSDIYMIMANLLLPRISKAKASPKLVEVPSMVKNIEAISMAFVSGKCVLLCGSVGCGKTSLVEHFATLNGRDRPPLFFKVQLGDQTDSKALIGSYCCSDMPGEFIWKPGVLTRAVKEGRWLLLEDIDSALMDVISLLIPLLESRVLSIPGRDNIPAAPGFQLFATQRVGQVAGGFNSASLMLDHLWSKVNVLPLSKDELEQIVFTKFSNLAKLTKKLVDTFSLLASDPHLIPNADTRTLGVDKRMCTVRDFMKWCRRLNSLNRQLTSQDIFQEAIDCFCATIPNPEQKQGMALAIGAKLNMNKAKVEFVLDLYKPDVKVAPLCFTVGRITLNREKRDDDPMEIPNFAFTRHSLILLESLAACVSQNEPVLLVGETGTGKTSAVQYLASLCNRGLVVVNMSQQSDSTDLIGGFKPMEMKQLVAPVREEFETLFCSTFSRKQNVKFLANVQQCFGKRKWEVLFQVILHAQRAALERFTGDTSDKRMLSLWNKLGQRVLHLRQQLKQADSAQAFSFVEGALVKAMKRGDWVLLDEINLATPETLECLNGILENQQGSVVVLERGDAEPVDRHEEFRMFACMNPANDIGKKDLPAGIRNRFTEIFVSELQDISDLNTLVVSYLQALSPPRPLVDGIVGFYPMIRNEASEKLTDGSGYRPYYSLRTLCRALKFASRNIHGNLLLSVYEGFCISFLTQLNRSSHSIVEALLRDKLLGHVNAKSLVNQPLRKPALKNEEYLNFEGHWVCQGNLEPIQSSEYVFTSSVKDNLKCLARIVSARNFPVLIQGETSVGKTSLINWLAKASGNYCVRINNHEHTDIQEYLGCYTSDEAGKLVFKEGILVDAMRKGYWIILDELNLAPTDVLEALNRLLDENRELYIPEIEETVKAHPKFMLFATQNPPGQYGGRKVLSRAFRNRFVELHFEELPSQELEVILHKRCRLPKSYSKTLVTIMLELQVRRRGSTLFSGKQGFITLRDLFRWAERYSRCQEETGSFFDWSQQLAEDGYLLLACRCRHLQETKIVQEVIEKHMKRKIDTNSLFGDPRTTKLSNFSQKILRELVNNCPPAFSHVVFTYNMRRLAVLVGRALQFNEPVLLVGDTGCGKTTICQIFAAVRKKKMYAVNCHLHTETSDFLGGLRPARKNKSADKEKPLRLFEWCDGGLVLAMREGNVFLADEISLADDSVLERLNSVLEPERTLILAEKGSSESEQELDLIVAASGFQLLATMNPGGDYGKKELSPALRNRFTEIWCPAMDNAEDMVAIIEHNLVPGVTLDRLPQGFSGVGNAMIEFVKWFKQNNFAKRSLVTVRDFLSWVKFINTCCSPDSGKTSLAPAQAYYHGAFLVFLDALGLGVMVNSGATSSARQLCSQFLLNQLAESTGDAGIEMMDTDVDKNNEMFTFGCFGIPRGPEVCRNIHNEYALNACTTGDNARRIMRALQLRRPILLEGSPGVGKTSLVSALAKASGHRLVRINLSEQTDISDLFGADLPVEGQGCQFSWCDGPLLQALKSGSWIVLDELNLASQSVLEGLNACFDHRGEIFIPELGASFHVEHDRTKFFACQNPLNQGGGRKGLPKSFLNRFTQVYVEALTREDLIFISQAMYPTIDQNTLKKMITFNSQVYQHCVVEGLCSKQAGSWEFNLRDIFRWCDLMIEYQNCSYWDPVAFIHMIYVARMRTDVCRNKVWELSSSLFGDNSVKEITTLIHATPSHIQIGHCVFPKSKSHVQDDTFQSGSLFLLHRLLKPLENLLTCLKMNWLAILVGPKSSCKTSLARLASQLTGTKLDVMAMNSSIDTTELLGGFEQADVERQFSDVKVRVKEDLCRLCRRLLLEKNFTSSLAEMRRILNSWFLFDEENVSSDSSMLDKISQLSRIIYEATTVSQKYQFTDQGFEQLNVVVTKLNEDLLHRNGNSHVSGQFEWVDGQLVKALKNGHWLLIDNVNFCSASVLDRLNCLLEPGGVLSINERGVVDGEIPLVKPHPNFRLIFAMDSKHGEISRAMRNRGVEIFMSNENVDCDDLVSMLCASGCKNALTVQTLANYYDQHKPGSLLQIIHAGSLISELCQRGLDREKCFLMAVNHVYGKNQDFEQKLNATQCFLQIGKNSRNPTALNFQKDAVNAMILRHSSPFNTILEDDSPTVVATAVNVFLEWCNINDWVTRLRWLKSNLPSMRKQDDDLNTDLKRAKYCLERLFESKIVEQLYILYEELDVKLKGCNLDAKYQPFNIRVNGPLYNYICCKISGDEELSCKLISGTNRVHLFWTYLSLVAKMESSVRKVHLQTPLMMSLSYTKHESTSEMFPHKGIPHIYPLLLSLQKSVQSFLENTEFLIDDQSSFKIWTCLKEYRQFLDVCTRTYSQNEDHHVLFDLHWKFFNNGALQTLCEVFNHFHCETAFQEISIVRKCLNEICSREQELTSYHWKMIGKFEHPTVFVSEKIYLTWEKLVKLYRSHLQRTEENVPEIRERQKIFLKDISSLIKLREEKRRDDCAQHILSSVDKDLKGLELRDETMDMLSKLSEISIDSDEESLSKFLTCKVVQSYSKLVARFAHIDCFNKLKLLSLREKILDRANVSHSIVECKLKSLNSFSTKYLSEIPLNTAVVQYFLLKLQEENGFSECLKSVLKLSDMFCELPEVKHPENNVYSRVASPLPNSECFVNTFQELSLPTMAGQSFSRKEMCLFEVDTKIAEYNHLSSFLWLHQNYFANMESLGISMEWQSLKLAFVRLFHCLTSIKEYTDNEFILEHLLGWSDCFQIAEMATTSLKNYFDDLVEIYGRVPSTKDVSILKGCFSELLDGFRTIAETGIDEENSKTFKSKIRQGICWVYLGMIQSFLLRPVGNVDPVEEINVKVANIKQEISELTCELNVRAKSEEILSGISIGERSGSLQVNPSHVNNLCQYRDALDSELSTLGNEVAYRPVPSQFVKISEKLRHFFKTVGDYSDIFRIFSSLSTWASRDVDRGVAEVKRNVLYLKTWLKSVRNFILQLNEYVAYEDVLAPCVCGLIQIVQGSELVISAVESKLKWKEFNIKSYLPQQIISYLLPKAFEDSFDVHVLLSDEISLGIQALCSTSMVTIAESEEASERLKSRTQMLALKVLQRSVVRAGYTRPEDIEQLKLIIQCFKNLWLEREKERKSREEEGESLYKFKTRTYCDDAISDEKQDQKEIDEFFTSFDEEYKYLDSKETMPASRVEKNQDSSDRNSTLDQILDTCMAEFCEIHQFLVSSAPNVCQTIATLDNTCWKDRKVRFDDVRITLESYNIAAEIADIASLCDNDLLANTTEKHSRMTSLLLKDLSFCRNESTSQQMESDGNILFQSRSQEYDIYHDSNLKEIIQVLPILASFKTRLEELLSQWPEHPTLVQLCQTIERITSFSVTSSVMKILNGLEILLRHSQEWESNASKHVSIRNHLDQITQMIIQWRKLELSCWSSLLRVCENKIREKANHWWFHLHHVIQEYSEHTGDKSTEFSEFIRVLQQFLESSPLGEFSQRLKILICFYNQQTVDPAQNSNSGVVKTILWNICSYYKQFETCVQSMIQKAKTPIEKELKDFINIVKWKDLNYWAMKETCAKSHYTLLKIMKKYQSALSEGLGAVLLSSFSQDTFSEEHNVLHDNMPSLPLQADNFLSPLVYKDFEYKDISEDSQNSSQIFSRMRKLTKQKLQVLNYEILSNSVRKFTEEIVSTAKSLQKLEIGNKTGKERTQFHKHILALKKRALADLFKALRKLGLSYRKGISLRQQCLLKDPMMINCADVSRKLKNMTDLLKNEASDVIPMLEANLNYYQKCVARSAILNNVVFSPSKDLTVGDVDRMKGLAEHLRQITQRQREKISNVGELFSDLSLITRQLRDFSSNRRLPPQNKMAEWTVKLVEILCSGLEMSENFMYFLESCPEKKIDPDMSPISEHLSKLSKSCTQDNAFIRSKHAIRTFKEIVSEIKSKLYLQTLMLFPYSNDKMKKRDVFIATWSHFESLRLYFPQLKTSLKYLDECIELSTSDKLHGKPLFCLRESIAKTCDEFEKWNEVIFERMQNDVSDDEYSTLRTKLRSTREKILLSFQKWYKRHEAVIIKAKDRLLSQEAEEETLDNKYFVENLDNELFEDISLLNIDEIRGEMISFMEQFKQAIDEKYNKKSLQALCEIALGIYPCLSQYVLLVEYYFSQLLLCHSTSCKLHSVLLGIFSELLQKGFCLPPDEEEGEGGSSFQDAEDCGIGEGEGMKDVSDQIEDEEQLHSAEQEKNDEGDENIADEENGVEMSEDFDGATHDVEERGECEDESEDESKDECDEQMGDVNGDEEILDEKLWADSDDDDGDNKENDAEERGAGTGGVDENEIVAKEENQGSTKESEEKAKQDETKDEINELGKDEDDQGNLDENFADNKNDIKLDEVEAEDMKLPEELDLDNQENDDIGDDFDDIDNVKSDGENDAIENDTVDENEIDDSDLQSNENQVEETSKEEQDNEQENQSDAEKNEDGDENVTENDWKTESITQEDNVQSMEDQGKPDASSGTLASDDTTERPPHDESMAEGDSEGSGNSIAQQSGLDSTDNCMTSNTTDAFSHEKSSYRKQLNKSRADRTLGSSDETAHKKPKVLDSSDDSFGENNQRLKMSDLFEHIRNEDEIHDTQVYDAATSEQQQQQKHFNYPSRDEGQEEDEHMEEDWELPPGHDARSTNRKEEQSGIRVQSDTPDLTEVERDSGEDTEMKVEDELNKEWLDTRSSVFMGNDPSLDVQHMHTLDPEKCRQELEDLLCKWRDLEQGSSEEQSIALDTWHKYEQLTSAHSQQLCEQLRIVLEPSIANKLRGDYRTGKRLNMRKVIPYIASQYRKDKIWLRRTMKSKRQYQIMLAIDDSSSMGDNKSKQLAFESLAVITNALTRLEAGEIAICSFGEEVQLLHPFHETFTDQSGADILRQFHFEQKKTKIAQLLSSCTSVMTSSRSRVSTRSDTSQLLLIVSDGRGIFLEGVETVQKAVRMAREAGIFLVFVILDNPTNRDSILDIKVPIFRQNELPELKSYIEQFPFQFYIVLRDISSLPETLSDSLRQWFELVTNMT